MEKAKAIISDNGISEDRFPDDQTDEQDEQTISCPPVRKKDEKTLILGDKKNLNSQKAEIEKCSGRRGVSIILSLGQRRNGFCLFC